ncbi:MAG TPA: carboxymuconolactone decarboxylase family protein [Bauldia sp.]|nr:carboxymuconolactone decarboxylase family protein [Bauldia sp.]
MTTELYAKALAKAQEYRGDKAKLGEGPLARLAPEVDRLKDELLWGVLWSEPSVDLKTRSLCTISALIVLGSEEQLRNHMRWALSIGITKEQLVSICSQMLLYGGLPATHTAMRVASEVLAEKEKN